MTHATRHSIHVPHPGTTLIAVAVSTLLLAGCDWVDSTGSSRDDDSEIIQVFLDDVRIDESVVLRENSPVRLTATRNSVNGNRQRFDWSETALEEGVIDACLASDGVDRQSSVATLTEACSDGESCALEFEPLDDSGDEVAEFRVRVPSLRASVGLRHALTVRDAEDTDDPGEVREYLFCLVAVNDEPVANDDSYVVLEGATLSVDADGRGLLANDSDDDDIRNQPLRVLEVPADAPEFAQSLTLNADGSFVYVPLDEPLASDRSDSFAYAITDGQFESVGQVSVRVVANNLAPVQLEPIPAQMAVSGEPFDLDLSVFFEDPEGLRLRFSIPPGELPSAGTLSLTANGRLSGTPAAADVGNVELPLSVTDGASTIVATLLLDIQMGADIDDTAGAPVFVPATLRDQVVVLGDFISPMTAEFEDPEGDVLTFSAAEPPVGSPFPDGVEVDADTGVVFGRPTASGLSRNLRVLATDPDGNVGRSDAFSISVR